MSNSSVGHWIKAARLRTLPLALSTIISGGAIALSINKFDGLIFSLAILTTILLQVLSNFANDYGDFKNGADLVEGREDRMLSSGAISESQMKRGLLIMVILSFISGITLLFISFGIEQLIKIFILLAIGLGAIWAALKYTAGKNPYGYRGLGDVFVFIFFGLVGVMGSAYLFSQEFLWFSRTYAFAIGALSVAVLNLNNMRDIPTDKEVDKITIPVRLGLEKAKVYHVMLFLVAWFYLGLTLWGNFHWIKLTFLLPLALHIKHLIFVFKITENKALDGELKKIAISTFMISILLISVQLF